MRGARLSPRSQEPGLFRRDGIADGNDAAGDHLGIDSAITMAEAALQRLWNVEIAGRTFGIDIDGGAALDPLDHLQPRVADGKGLTEQFELVPGRPAADVEVSAEPQGVNGHVDHVLDGSEAAEIDDGDDLPGDIGKAVAAARENFGRSLDRRG